MRAAVAKHYGTQLDAFQEVISYGCDCLIEALALQTSAPAHQTVQGCLFRQVLAMADGVYLALESGASYAARVPARALLEAAATLEFTLVGDTKRLARQYVVGSYRRLRRSVLRAIEGSPESEQGNAARRIQHGDGLPFMDHSQTELKAQADEIERRLYNDDFREVAQRFEAQNPLNTPHEEPEWFAVGDGDPRSYNKLFERVGRPYARVLWYETLTDAVHNKYHESHLAPAGPGSRRLEPIRRAADIPLLLDLCVDELVRSIQLVIDRYLPSRSDELALLLSRWRPRLLAVGIDP